MATYAITIGIVEYYHKTFLVNAKSKAEATRKIKREYEEDDYLYNNTTDNRTDVEVKFKAPIEVENKSGFVDII